jgi:hypothetical protein
MVNQRSGFVFYVMLLFVLAVALCGCGSVQEQDRITIIENKQVQGEAVDKVMQVNNCEGSEEMVQEMQAVHQYTHEIQITPRSGVKVNRKAVEDEIRSYYRIPQEQSDAVCVIPVQIPAGAYYTYDLEWTEVWREGVFELDEPDGRDEGTYRFRQSMLCEVVGQQAETCPNE